MNSSIFLSDKDTSLLKFNFFQKKQKILKKMKNLMQILNVIALLQIFFVLLSCSDNPTKPGDEIDLNPKLNSVFYWGIEDPTNLIPNSGLSFGQPVIFPTWVRINKMYFYSAELKNNIWRKGIFEIEINPGDHSTVNNEYLIYEYEHYIVNMFYISATNEFLLLVNKDVGNTAVIAQLDDNNVIEKEILLNNDWEAEGIAYWHQNEGFIFYGRNPQNGIYGFYSLLKNTGNNYQTELIYSTADPGIDKLNFITTYDGENLIFGLNEGDLNSPTSMQLLKLPLIQQNPMPVVIFERNGGYIYVTQNPVNQELFLINYFYGGDSTNEPQGHIELFNANTIKSIDLNVRTHKALNRFIINDHPDWSPDGKHFAFSAGAFDGEAGIYHLELWVYENVP